MLDDLHIVDFCNDVARFLLVLHQQFPRQVEVYISDLIGPEEPDEYGMYSRRHESCLATALWLKTEGWLRFDNVVRREAVDQCVLTQKAFHQLHCTLPQALLHALLTATTAEDDAATSTHSQHASTLPVKPLTVRNLRLIQGLHLAHRHQRSELIQDLVMHLLASSYHPAEITNTENPSLL